MDPQSKGTCKGASSQARLTRRWDENSRQDANFSLPEDEEVMSPVIVDRQTVDLQSEEAVALAASFAALDGGDGKPLPPPEQLLSSLGWHVEQRTQRAQHIRYIFFVFVVVRVISFCTYHY